MKANRYALNQQNCNIIAIDRELQQKARLQSSLFISEGKLLTLALLPAILDQQRENWREENISINCNGNAGCLAALRLMSETRYLNLIGNHADKVSEFLFRKHGMITNTGHSYFSLNQLTLPRQLTTVRGDIPIEIAEALLIIASGNYPRRDLRYFRQLLLMAEENGFELTKTLSPPSSSLAIVCK